MENFNFKEYLTKNTLLKENTPSDVEESSTNNFQKKTQLMKDIYQVIKNKMEDFTEDEILEVLNDVISIFNEKD
jgi:hypothetical protein